MRARGCVCACADVCIRIGMRLIYAFALNLACPTLVIQCYFTIGLPCQAKGFEGQRVLDEGVRTQALEIMRDQGISGLAIVNAGGQLMGNFSISDLRCAPAGGHAA